MAQTEPGDWMQQLGARSSKKRGTTIATRTVSRAILDPCSRRRAWRPHRASRSSWWKIASVVHLTLPAKITADISENDLETVAGGGKIGGIWWGGSNVRFSSALSVNQLLINSLLRFNR